MRMESGNAHVQQPRHALPGDEGLEVATGFVLREGISGSFAPRPAWRPQTKFETRGMKLGHGVWDIVFRRVQ